jgi:hypothetical protein
MRPPVAFKEWQVVCAALAAGCQSILLRKGGIHEGRQGFSFAHESFFLFPTRFHATAEQVREGEIAAAPEWQPGDTVRITHYAETAWAITLTEWQQVSALAPLHIYTEKNVHDRFHWQGPDMASGSIHLALVRTHLLTEAWEFPYEAKYGGCRSWVELPAHPTGMKESALPVLSDRDFDNLVSQLEQRIRPTVI